MGSVHVNCHDPIGAAREIDRLGGHPRMAQAILYIGDKAWGDPFYLPIFEAAVRNNLPVGMHHSENSPTALGFHRYYVEWHTLVPQVFMSELVSLMFNGVFDRFPELKVVMIEGGLHLGAPPDVARRPAVQAAPLRGAVGQAQAEPDHP